MPRSILPIPPRPDFRLTSSMAHVPDAIAALRRAQGSTSVLQISECLHSCGVYLKAAQAALKLDNIRDTPQDVNSDEEAVLHIIGLQQQPDIEPGLNTNSSFIPTRLLKESA